METTETFLKIKYKQEHILLICESNQWHILLFKQYVHRGKKVYTQPDQNLNLMHVVMYRADCMHAEIQKTKTEANGNLYFPFNLIIYYQLMDIH